MGDETAKEVTFKGAHLEGGSNDTPRSKFLSVWKDYKEFVAILVFFLTGSLWIWGFFATKKQLNDLQCLLNVNIDLIQAKIDSESLSQLVAQNFEKKKAILSKNALTAEDKQRRDQLDTAAKDILQKLNSSQDAATQALEKLRKGACTTG